MFEDSFIEWAPERTYDLVLAKGVLIHVLAGILADYAVNAAMETFTAAKHDRHPTEIAASLRGARAAAGGGRLIAVFQPGTFSRARSNAPSASSTPTGSAQESSPRFGA